MIVVEQLLAQDYSMPFVIALLGEKLLRLSSELCDRDNLSEKINKNWKLGKNAETKQKIVEEKASCIRSTTGGKAERGKLCCEESSNENL